MSIPGRPTPRIERVRNLKKSIDDIITFYVVLGGEKDATEIQVYILRSSEGHIRVLWMEKIPGYRTVIKEFYNLVYQWIVAYFKVNIESITHYSVTAYAA
ncbi:MAG: hypothetical protein ACFFG0_10725, partial [Candidatus Thorarchaeota archaeon]